MTLQFSVATPSRNALPALRRCVGSVRRLTSHPHEHIIQDALSTDGTREWLATQAQIDWRSEADAGMYDAINRAWARSRGDILSWLNADEQYLPDALCLVAGAFEQHPEYDAVFGNYIVVNADSGQPLAARREIPLRRFYVANWKLNAQSCTLFFRRRLLDRGLLRFDDRWRDVGDASLILNLLREGVVIGHIGAYLSLFGATGANMSTGANAVAESATLRRPRGSAAAGARQVVARILRSFEKLARGCYRPDNLVFPFCVDEHGTTREVMAEGVSTEWDLTGDECA